MTVPSLAVTGRLVSVTDRSLVTTVRSVSMTVAFLAMTRCLGNVRERSLIVTRRRVRMTVSSLVLPRHLVRTAVGIPGLYRHFSLRWICFGARGSVGAPPGSAQQRVER